MNATLRSLLAEPKVENPPPTGRFDVLLVMCVLCGLVLEALLRTNVLWKPLALTTTAILSTTLLIRRRYPLLALAALMGSFLIYDLTGTLLGRGPVEVYSSAFVLILIYALFRWGSGRDAGRGVVLLVVASVLIQLTNFTNIGDLIGGTIVLYMPAAIGTIVRYQDSIRRHRDERHLQRLESVKVAEREQLARDLHDTVAHHVSAIAIQAQAGQVLAQTSPDAAMEALAVIENEASHTLAEMRAIVRALRDDDEGAEHAPQRGISEIASLATSTNHGPSVHVDIDGETTGVAPSIDAAVFRLAQESITNSVRHAKGATQVHVHVQIDADEVTLAVTDDGSAPTTSVDGEGWGLVGMAERAELLGGTLQAGPGPQSGWQVRAVLPRDLSQQPSRS